MLYAHWRTHDNTRESIVQHVQSYMIDHGPSAAGAPLEVSVSIDPIDQTWMCEIRNVGDDKISMKTAAYTLHALRTWILTNTVLARPMFRIIDMETIQAITCTHRTYHTDFATEDDLILSYYVVSDHAGCELRTPPRPIYTQSLHDLVSWIF